MKKKLILILTLSAATLITTPATAQTEDAGQAPGELVAAIANVQPATADLEPAKPAVAPDSQAKAEQSDDLGTLGKEAEELARAGKWIAALGALMLFLVAVFRKFIFARVDWFRTKKGGYTAAGGVALATILGLGLKAGFSVEMILAVLSAAFAASGMHTALGDFKSSRES